MTYYIIDKDLKVYDKSENMLELRLECYALNKRLGENEDECQVVSETELLELNKQSDKRD